MNRTFRIGRGSRVPDGTMVFPFLNPADSTSSLPPDLFAGFSVAGGEIAPRQRSKIHVMPFVTQVTFVLEGSLEARMKDPENPQPYTLALAPQEAALTRPGTFLQLANRTDLPARVLYIVSPSYLFVAGDRGQILFDDAVVLDQDWGGLEGCDWRPPQLLMPGITLEKRQEAAARKWRTP